MKMTGTEKQIKWALDIKEMAKIDKEILDYCISELDNESHESFLEQEGISKNQVERYYKEIDRCEDSAFLIKYFSGWSKEFLLNLKETLIKKGTISKNNLEKEYCTVNKRERDSYLYEIKQKRDCTILARRHFYIESRRHFFNNPFTLSDFIKEVKEVRDVPGLIDKLICKTKTLNENTIKLMIRFYGKGYALEYKAKDNNLDKLIKQIKKELVELQELGCDIKLIELNK